MKKAIDFYNQMTQEEKDEYFQEFKFQRPHIKMTEWLENNSFRTFENFLDKSFDHRRFVKPNSRVKYTFWFNVMIKYNVSSPMNFTEL